MPFLFIASMIRMIDAVKSFDIIFAITQGGPGTASETINLYLYSVAFVYYDVGYASAIVVVFFALIVALAGALLRLPQTTHSNDTRAISCSHAIRPSSPILFPCFFCSNGWDCSAPCGLRSPSSLS